MTLPNCSLACGHSASAPCTVCDFVQVKIPDLEQLRKRLICKLKKCVGSKRRLGPWAPQWQKFAGPTTQTQTWLQRQLGGGGGGPGTWCLTSSGRWPLSTGSCSDMPRCPCRYPSPRNRSSCLAGQCSAPRPKLGDKSTRKLPLPSAKHLKEEGSPYTQTAMLLVDTACSGWDLSRCRSNERVFRGNEQSMERHATLEWVSAHIP